MSGALVGERAERTEDVMQDGPSEGSRVHPVLLPFFILHILLQ